MSEGLSAQKKASIWDLFFAAQFLWPQHFLHGISDDIYGPIYVLNNKKKLEKLINIVFWKTFIANFLKK